MSWDSRGPGAGASGEARAAGWRQVPWAMPCDGHPPARAELQSSFIGVAYAPGAA